MVQPKDPSLIPSGRYCYRFVKVAPGEVVLPAGAEMGRAQRESEGYNPLVKRVLCPYFERSGYGTVRCLYLGKEVAFDFLREQIAPRVAARFGVLDAVDWFEGDSLLWDMVKVCDEGGGESKDEDGDETDTQSLDHVSAATPVLAPHGFLQGLKPGERVDCPPCGVDVATRVHDELDRRHGQANFIRRDAEARRKPQWLQLPPWLLQSAAGTVRDDLGGTGLVGPFATGPELPGVRWSRWRNKSASPFLLGDRMPRLVQAAAPAFTQLRVAMSRVTSHPWWRFDEARKPFWCAGQEVQSVEDQTPGPSSGLVRVLNIRDLPDEAQLSMASVTLLDLFGHLQAQIQALRQAAIANGRWWPAPQSIELVLVAESWVGLHMRFPLGYQLPGADWIAVWHPMQPRAFPPPLSLVSGASTESVPVLPRRQRAPEQIYTPVNIRLTATLPTPTPTPTPTPSWYAAPSVAPAPPAPPAEPPPLPGCVWLLQTHVAGMAYHQAEQAMDSLHAGSLLQLRREPSNAHDALAIEVLTESGLKLGYVPRNRNPVLARLMDAGQVLAAQVLSVGSFPSHPQPWQTPLPEVRFRIDWRPAEPTTIHIGA